MSTEHLEQPTLDAFNTPAEPEPTVVEHDEDFEGAAFRPDLREALQPKTGITESPLPECQRCESSVSRDFARVFGDNSGVVHACPFCDDVDRNEIYRGAASGAEHAKGDRL